MQLGCISLYNCNNNFTYDCFNNWNTFKSIVHSSLPCSAALCLDLVVIDHGAFILLYPALCLDLVDIEFGMVAFTGNSIGDTATYSCNPGFELIGEATTTCTLVDAYSAILQPAPPFCRREYVMHRVATGCLILLV